VQPGRLFSVHSGGLYLSVRPGGLHSLVSFCLVGSFIIKQATVSFYCSLFCEVSACFVRAD
jgi:hypothetical protein